MRVYAWVKTQSFKVLSSEMDLAKRGLIRKALIKRRGVEIPANFVRPPSSESHLKIRRHLVQLLDPNSQRGHVKSFALLE